MCTSIYYHRCLTFSNSYFLITFYDHVFYKMSGPIDLVLIHQVTGETRYIDVKYKNTRQGTKNRGRRINRPITTPLKNKIKIEAIYVGEDGQLEKAYSKGFKQWHKEFELEKNEKGR